MGSLMLLQIRKLGKSFSAMSLGADVGLTNPKLQLQGMKYVREETHLSRRHIDVKEAVYRRRRGSGGYRLRRMSNSPRDDGAREASRLEYIRIRGGGAIVLCCRRTLVGYIHTLCLGLLVDVSHSI